MLTGTFDKINGFLKAKFAWIAIVSIVLYMVASTSTANYSPDSWSYVDIARSFFSEKREIGEILGTRDYSNLPWKNDSFPFFWPFIIALFLNLTGPITPIGAYLFVLIWLSTVIVFVDFMKRLQIRDQFTPLLGVLLFSIPGYLDEGTAGRTIPFNILLLMIAVNLLYRHLNNRSSLNAVVIGICLGICAATRFDGLVYGPFLIFFALRFAAFSFRDSLVAISSWSLFPMTWVIYSVRNFGVPYVSDSAIVLFGENNSSVTDWRPLAAQSNLNPLALMKKASSNVPLILKTFVISYKYFVLAILCSLLILVTVYGLKKWIIAAKSAFKIIESDRVIKKWVKVTQATSICVGLFQLLILSGSSYPDVRYWIPLTVLFTCGAIPALQRLFQAISYSGSTRILSERYLRFAMFPILFLALQTMQFEYRNVVDTTKTDQRIIECLNQHSGVAIISGLEAFRLPATQNSRWATPPGNAELLTKEDWQALRDEYGIDSWIVKSEIEKKHIPKVAKTVLRIIECN